MTATFLVTGANKGIGLALVKKILSNKENYVIATARNVEKATDLKKLADESKRVNIVQLDLANASSIDEFDEQLKGVDKIDYFVSNAGIANSCYTILKTDTKDYLEHYNVNALGPILLFKKVYKYFQHSDIKKLIFLSTMASSISGMPPIPISAYGSSKATLNYLVKELSWELAPEGFTAVAVHPGTVKSDLTIASFPMMKESIEKLGISIPLITTDESASDIYDVIMKPGEDLNGKFITNTGDELAF